VIRSPIDGTVVARNVDVGQTVAASLQAPTIFTIAQDLTKMLVYTKTDESDVGNIKPGKPVTFKVDAFPKDTFHGIVSQVRMKPDHGAKRGHLRHNHRICESRVETVPRNDSLRNHSCGQCAERIESVEHSSSLQAPMGPEEILAIYKQYGSKEVRDSRR